MSNFEINIVVEGFTEQSFIREVLAPELAVTDIYLFPTLIGKAGSKGGDVSFDRALNDIKNHLKQRRNTYVTTMFDYYKINLKLPGISKVQQHSKTGKSLSSSEKAVIVEEETKKAVIESFPNCKADKRFIPYIQMYELEALLYSKGDDLAQVTGIKSSLIQSICNRFDNPEEINDNPNTAPSKRLQKLSLQYLNRDYPKIRTATAVAGKTGIKVIRQECPHFNDWVSKLENLPAIS